MPEIAAPPSPPEPRYWAFISYSHADQKHARSLHKRMEAFRGHKKLVGTIGRGGAAVPPRAYPIFLDRDELEGAADLAGRINDALRASRFLIVICSPRAARSRYVDQEIAFFKSLGREDRVLALIVAGEPHAADRPELGLEECFPPSLKLRIGHDGQPTGAPAEPLAADLRPGKDDPHDALLKILAGVLGLGFDDLRRRDQQRRLRLRTLWSGLATVLALVFLGLAISAYVTKQEATRQGQIALARQLAAQSELARADPQRSRESLELALRATEVLAGQEGARSFDVDAALRRSLALTPRQVPAPDAGPAMPASTGASAAEPPLREEGLLAINAQAGLTATAAPDGVHVTEVATGRQTVLAHPRDPDLPAAPGNTVYPHSAAFAADGKQLAVGYDYAEYHKRHYGGVTLWRLGDAPGKADGWTSDEPVSLLRYDRDGRLYWGDAQAIHIGAKRDGFTIPGAGKDGLFAINEGGDRVATASAAGLIRLWDVKDHQEQWRLGPGAEARGLRFIEDTGTLAVTDASGRASFWPAQASAFSEETFAVPATAPPGSQLLALNPDAGLLMSIDQPQVSFTASHYTP